jgi:hypothetical protein
VPASHVDDPLLTEALSQALRQNPKKRGMLATSQAAFIILVVLGCLVSCGGGAAGGGAGGGGAGGRDSIKQFDWPPPNPTTRTTIPRELLAKPAPAKTYLYDIDQQLSDALDSGHYQRSYYAAPDGFAVVTRLERYDPDSGAPMIGKDRWAPRVELTEVRRETFFERFVQALYSARDGYYRVIVFTVSPMDLHTKGSVSRDEAYQWLEEGSRELPPSIGTRSYTEEYKTTALIYEFERPAHEQQTRFLEQGNLRAKAQLTAAKIWTILET